MTFYKSLPALAIFPLYMLASACTVEEAQLELSQSTAALNGFAPSSETDGSEESAGSFGFANLPDTRNDAQDENPCPEGFEFSVNSDAVAFCVLHDIPMPQTDSAQAYTADLATGYLGYSWDMNDDPKYTCPSSMRSIRTTEAIGYCVFSGIWVPDSESLASYVDEFETGSLGFSWYLEDTDGYDAPIRFRHD